jgi:hypothetical protein
MKISDWDFGKSQRVLCRYENRQKATIPKHFLGIFEIFEGGKGTQDHKSRKNYLVDILPPQQSKLCLEEFFPNFSLFGR